MEKRIGEVAGVESVTVDYAAGSATVRYDETRLNVADIKSAVRQSGNESGAPAAASAGDGHEGHTTPGAPSATSAPAEPKPLPAAAPRPTPVAPKSDPNVASTAPASAVPAGDGQKDKAAPGNS